MKVRLMWKDDQAQDDVYALDDKERGEIEALLAKYGLDSEYLSIDIDTEAPVGKQIAITNEIVTHRTGKPRAPVRQVVAYIVPAGEV